MATKKKAKSHSASNKEKTNRKTGLQKTRAQLRERLDLLEFRVLNRAIRKHIIYGKHASENRVNKSDVARTMGVSRVKAIRLMKKHGFESLIREPYRK